MQEEIQYIKNLLLQQKRPSYQTTNGQEVRVRCPYCGDGKNPSDAHFYISMKPPFCFHCFKCETSGVLSNQVLRDLEVFDSNLAASLITANKSIKNDPNQKVYFKKRELKNTAIDSELSRNAISYFNNRYNTNFTNEFITEKFKTITDPINFFNENNINPPQLYDYSKAIGFISSDGSHLIFRDISGQQKTRYFNLALCSNDEINTISKMYNIQSEIDLLQDEVNLIITEGIFDIIGVYSHFYQNNYKNAIFAAACGKGYNAIILNYIRRGFLNLNITIYSDGDVEPYFYRNLKNSSPYLKNNKLTIFYNALYNPVTKFGKDYGVPKEQIKLKKIII